MTDPQTPATEAGPQRYELAIEPDDSCYLELDPDGPWCLADEAERLIAEARADALREAAERMDRTLPQYVDMHDLHWWPQKSVLAILDPETT